MPKAHEFVPSQVDPFEWHLLVRVHSDRMENQVAAPVRLTTFEALDIPDKPPLEGLMKNGKNVSTWLLSSMERVDEGWVQFRFVPPKTKAERSGSPFQTGWTQKPHTWPAVISKPRFSIDPANPRLGEVAEDTIYLPRGVIEIDDMQAPQSGFWKVKVESFVCAEGFDEEEMEARRPLPEPVSISYHGEVREFSEVLHPAFIVPRQAEAPVDGSGVAVNYRIVEAVKYQATNFQRWAPFVLRDEAVFIKGEGVWLRERETIYPQSTLGRQQL